MNNININIANLEEEQTKLTEKCTSLNKKKGDLNECMYIENEEISCTSRNYYTNQISGHFHRKMTKKKSYVCSKCDTTFRHSFALEEHLVTIHESEKPFECDLCKVKFVLKSRYMIHKNSHRELNTRKCHYFNNEKLCPFAKMGCKFRHEDASYCKYSNNCERPMCQYKHWIVLFNTDKVLKYWISKKKPKHDMWIKIKNSEEEEVRYRTRQ